MSDRLTTQPAAMLTVAVCLLGWPSGLALGGEARARGPGDTDHAGLISRADLVYDRPVGRSEEGMPLGNGRMGSLVWTTPTALRASFDKSEKIADRALAQMDAGLGRGFDGLLDSNKAWWRDFWGKSFIDLHSDDGVADRIEQNYTYYLYVMASSSRGAKIAYTYWQRYEYTLDEVWLRDRGYPMLKGVAEFYRNYPNLKKGPDGNTMPQWFFDLCTLENDDPETMKIANATMDGYLRGPDTRPGVLSKVGVTAAVMGRADAIRYLLPNQLSFPDRAPVLMDRLDQREGVQTTNAQRLGRVADTLLQSVGAGPAREPVIRVFPAWPREWDAEFSLLARGAFLAGSSMKAGRIESQAGGECRLRNPWPGATVILERSGDQAEDLSGDLLRFSTTKGEAITIRPLR